MHQGTVIYLLYNGIFKDRTPEGGNVLTPTVYAALTPHEGFRIIYAAAKRGFSAAQLARAGIVFRQTPYRLRD